MATKLKKMRLTSVDLVRAGANQEADICLFKSDTPPEATESPTEAETNIFKRFIDWMRKNPTEAENEPHSHIEKGKETPDIEYVYKSALAESLHSIMQDDTLTEIEKKEMTEESLRQYAEKIRELEDAEEDYDGGDDIDEKAIEEVDDFDKDDYPDYDDDTMEEEIIEEIRERPRRRYDIDEIEEVEVAKYNHNHGADGRFSSSPGAGGGGSSSGGSGSKKPSEMEYKELENEVLSIRSKLNTASREEKRELINRSFDLQTEMDRRLASGERGGGSSSGGKGSNGASPKQQKRADIIINSGLGYNNVDSAKRAAKEQANQRREEVSTFDAGSGRKAGRYVNASGKDASAMRATGHKEIGTALPDADRNITHPASSNAKKSANIDTIEEVAKFNPYHDAMGRFATANGAISMTVHTKSPAGQKAIANIKAKATGNPGGGAGGLNEKVKQIMNDAEPWEQATMISNLVNEMKIGDRVTTKNYKSGDVMEFEKLRDNGTIADFRNIKGTNHMASTEQVRSWVREGLTYADYIPSFKEGGGGAGVKIDYKPKALEFRIKNTFGQIERREAKILRSDKDVPVGYGKVGTIKDYTLWSNRSAKNIEYAKEIYATPNKTPKKKTPADYGFEAARAENVARNKTSMNKSAKDIINEIEEIGKEVGPAVWPLT